MTKCELAVEARAMALHGEAGFNCAESVLLAILETQGIAPCSLMPNLATCFGGGVGKTKEEMCGALSGGLIALGCVAGGRRPGLGWDFAADAGAELRERFRELRGATRCFDLLAGMAGPGAENPKPPHPLCKSLIGETARLTRDLIEELT